MFDENFKNVSAAIIQKNGTHFLLQLRDLDPSISNPGQWGLFAGERQKGEQPENAMIRELWEELEFMPQVIVPFKTFCFSDELLKVWVGSCCLDVPLSSLNLLEGQEYGLFSLKEIMSGKLFSKNLQKKCTVIQETLEILNTYTLKSKDNFC